MSSFGWLVLLQLTVLAVTTTAQFQFCGTRTCCPGKICGLNGKGTKERCTYAASCDQVECPMGFQCFPYSGRNTPGKRSKVKCRISCDNVNCPRFLECKTRGSGISSYAVCKYPRRCDQSNCPANTICTRTYKRRYGLCIADSCSQVNCGAGATCAEGKAKKGRKYTKFLKMILGVHKKKSYTKGTMAATCVARCTNTTCPEGLVCEQKKKYEIRCRAPRNCDELTCPTGYVCRVSSCGKRHRHTHTHTHKYSKSIAQCIPIPSIVPSSSVMASTVQSSPSFFTLSSTIDMSPSPSPSPSFFPPPPPSVPPPPIN